MSYYLELDIPGLPPLQGKKNWRAVMRSRKSWSDTVRWYCRNKAPGRPLTRASLEFIRCSSVEPDGDNLQHSFKPLRDGLVRAGIIADDTPAVVGTPAYCWAYAPKEKGRVEITVSEVRGDVCPECGQFLPT